MVHTVVEENRVRSKPRFRMLSPVDARGTPSPVELAARPSPVPFSRSEKWTSSQDSIQTFDEEEFCQDIEDIIPEYEKEHERFSPDLNETVASEATSVLKKDAAAVLSQLLAAQNGTAERVQVCQIAPAVFSSISEEFGMAPGSISGGQLVQALRRIGFEYIFDLRYAADITIMEEANELLERVKKGGPFPMFTSCCAGWMKSAEAQYPDLLPNLSTCKSPMSMMSAVIKSLWAERVGLAAEDITVTSVMPCTLKKIEAQRPQLIDERVSTDAVLTTRELAQLMKVGGVCWANLDGQGEEAQFSNLAGPGSGAGAIFGVTGGVMEAAVRTAYEVATKKEFPGLNVESVRGLEGVKEATVSLPGIADVSVCVVSGQSNVKRMLDQTRAGECPYHFVEIMMCQGGCINGPGQPRSSDPHILKKRMAAIYSDDERAIVRKSHENPTVQIIYSEYLKAPLSHKAHDLLHTEFKPAATGEGESDLPLSLCEKVDDISLILKEQPVDDVLVAFGSDSGNAEGVARVLAKELSRRGVWKVRCMEADAVDVEDLPNAKYFVVVTSTAGQGDFPENAKEFWNNLSASHRPKDFLAGIKFAVFGLGDSSYPLFCQAAKKVDYQLGELGATRFLIRGVGDDQHEERFETGFGEWAPAMLEVLKLEAPVETGEPEANYEVSVTAGTPEAVYTEFKESWKPVLTSPDAFYCKVVSNTRITSDDYDRDARHLVFDLTENYFKFGVGDCLAIYPRNNPVEVADFLQSYGLEPSNLVSYKFVSSDDSVKPKPTVPEGATLQTLFCDVLDVFGRPNSRFYEALARFACDETEKTRLLHLVTKDGREEYSKLVAESVTFADVLKLFPSAKPSLAHLIDMIPTIKPRYYSIASSQHRKPMNLELSIVVNDWKTPCGRVRIGTCTNYVRRLTGGAHYVAVSVRAGVGLCMPFNSGQPIIMAGLGTGLAPMRAMAQERDWQMEQGRNVGTSVLFFGCRHRAKDYLYGEEWEEYVKRGILDDVRVAFSRDQKAKVYIQNKMEEVPELLHDLLCNQGGYFFYCGSAGQVPKDIRAAMEKGLASAGNMSKEQASAKIDELILTGHYNVEAWS